MGKDMEDIMNIAIAELIRSAGVERYAMVTDITSVDFSDNEKLIAEITEDNETMDAIESLCRISNDGEESFCRQLENLFKKIFEAGAEYGFKEGVMSGFETGKEEERRNNEERQKLL